MYVTHYNILYYYILPKTLAIKYLQTTSMTGKWIAKFTTWHKNVIKTLNTFIII